MEQLKTCPHCKRALVHSAFDKNKSKRSGLCSWCKECAHPKAAEYRATHNDKIRAMQRAWVKANHEHVKENYKKWVANNEEKIRLYRENEKARARNGRPARPSNRNMLNKREYQKRWSQTHRENERLSKLKAKLAMNDAYVSRLIRRSIFNSTGARITNLPINIVEAKRAAIKIQRLIKEKQK